MSISIDNKKLGSRINDDDSRRIMIGVLKAVHCFCIKNKLRYSLYAGSLIGAIRHNGFIPWDDDIDIVMPREDYYYFIKHFKEQYYSVITPYSCKEYYLPWAKVYDNRTIKIEPVKLKSEYLFGVDIDVFPVDYVDSFESFKRVQKKKYRLNLLRNKSLKSFILFNPIRHPINFLREFFSRVFYQGRQSYFSKRLDCCYQSFNKKQHNYYMVNSLFFNRPLFDISLFDDLEFHKFEDEEFLVFKRYDYFLTLMFGNYMELPPTEQRISHHKNEQYYKL